LPDKGGVGVIEREVTLEITDHGDHDRFAHYILADDPGAAITKSIIDGTPIQALCGKVWVPSRDAKKYPVCPECKEIKDAILGRSNQ
jgi:hypothetical protein